MTQEAEGAEEQIIQLAKAQGTDAAVAAHETGNPRLQPRTSSKPRLLNRQAASCTHTGLAYSPRSALATLLSLRLGDSGPAPAATTPLRRAGAKSRIAGPLVRSQRSRSVREGLRLGVRFTIRAWKAQSRSHCEVGTPGALREVTVMGV